MNIKITESFLYNDFELIFSAKDAGDNEYIAMYSGDLPERIEYTMVPVERQSMASFREGKTDLRSLMLEKGKNHWYIMTVGNDYGDIERERQKSPLMETGRLPEPGYHPMKNTQERKNTQESKAVRPEI